MKLFGGNQINEEKIINQIRALSIDMINEAKSGHPGIALGAAPIIYTLYANHLNVIPDNPTFYNRDRFVLSAGHASALLYATLFMAGFDLSLDDLKKFRQIGSKTPGHPEYKTTNGIDATTGALGQGFATAVGMAIGEAHTRSLINDKDDVINYYTYAFVSDGDLMEGISYEAASLAGNLKLNKLIVLYDSNDITLDGEKNLSFNENIRERFEAMGWNTSLVSDANNLSSLNKAIDDAKKSDKPTLIEVKTIIGEYSKNQGTNIVHGTALSEDDITEIKNKLNMRNIAFSVTNDVLEDFQNLINDRVKDIEETFNSKYNKLDDDKKEFLNSLISHNKSISTSKLDFEINEIESPRNASGKILNAYYKNSKLLFGGSADLFSSCKNYIEGEGNFSSNNYSSPNIYFGVREHAMAGILNGLALVGYRPYASTFLAFSDYMKPSIRMAAMMDLSPIYIFTHDSVLLGEDGATHQPVEQLSSLRLTPNLDVFRPCDANEVVGCYKAIMQKDSGPSAITLSKTELPILEGTKINDVSKGGYIVKEEKLHLDGILIASGEEVHLAIEVSEKLFTKGIDLRVVSMPNLERFLSQSSKYIDKVLPIEKRKIVIELSNSSNWNKIVYNDKYIINQTDFGTSGKRKDILKKYKLDVSSLAKKIEKLLN